MDKIKNEKKTDLPPYGPRNADPITDEAGAHPIEAGLGAAAAGAATGFAAGLIAGPVGAVAGAIVGGLAGGYAGKAAGEWIDPTIDPVFVEEFPKRTYVRQGDTYETYTPVYQYGGKAESYYAGKDYTEVETAIQKEYEATPESKNLAWKAAKPAIEDGYNWARRMRSSKSAE
jgi:hypothetical protein